MEKLFKICKLVNINNILSIVLALLLFTIISKNNKSEYYNKIYEDLNSKYLSTNSMDLIILTVTGDENFTNSKIKEVYLYLQILHLLVLSGSNIVILLLFFSFIESKNKYSYLFIKYLALLNYLCYINFLYPVARAIIFNLIYDIFVNFGFKHSFKILFLTYSFSILLPYLIFDRPNSLLLSYLFSVSILIFNYFSSKIHISKLSKLLKFIIFSLYMSQVTSTLSLFFFSNFSFTRLLISNFLIVPIYEFFVFLMYLAYLIGFLPKFNIYLLPLLSFLLEILFRYLEYLTISFKSYNL